MECLLRNIGSLGQPEDINSDGEENAPPINFHAIDWTAFAGVEDHVLGDELKLALWKCYEARICGWPSRRFKCEIRQRLQNKGALVPQNLIHRLRFFKQAVSAETISRVASEQKVSPAEVAREFSKTIEVYLLQQRVLTEVLNEMAEAHRGSPEEIDDESTEQAPVSRVRRMLRALLNRFRT